MEDSDIVDLYWARSENAISETDRKYGRYCGAIAFNILHSREDSDECVNDTWLRAWNAMPSERPGLLGAFLARITRNLSLNRFRALHAEKRGAGELPCLIDELEECVPDNRRSVETEIDGQQLTTLVNQFLAGLAREHRVFFVRRYFYADSVGYIANRCGVSESKVKSSLMRSRNRLRALLEREGVAM